MEEILLLNMIKNPVAEKNGNKMKILKQGAEAKPFFFVNTKIGKQFWCAKFPWKFERKKALRERKNNMQNLKEKMIIQQGAEAIIYRDGDKLIKERIPKCYRIKEIDDKIRKLRTRSEGRLLMKAENTPNVFLVDCDKYIIEMEFIDGELVKDVLNGLNVHERKELCREIGVNVAGLHDNNVIHGDLTTSNMVVKEKLYFIDFGLGFISSRIEDKAVDLHLLRRALEGKHYLIADGCFDFVLDGYKNSPEYEKVFKQLVKVEMRGRYKRKNGAL